MPPPTKTYSSLAVSPDRLDLGAVWSQTDFKWRLLIRNQTFEPITIVDFRTSCSCTSVAPVPLTILPGKAGIAEVTLDLTTEDREEGLQESRQVAVGVMPQTDPPLETPIEWILRAHVKNAISIDPPVVDLGQFQRGGKIPTRIVRGVCHVPVDSLHALTESNAVNVVIEALAPKIAGEQQCFEIAVSPDPLLPAGRIDVSIPLTAILETGDRIPPVRLIVRGHLRERIEAYPSNVIFGVVMPGTTVDETVALVGREGAKLDYLGPKGSVADELTVSVIERGERTRIRVEFTPSAVGRFESTLKLLIRDRVAEQTTEVLVPVFAHVSETASAEANRSGETK